MKRFFHSLTFKSKIFVTFATVQTIVIITLAITIYFSNINEMKNQAQSLSNVLSNQFSRTINLYFQDIERISLALFSDSYVQETFSNYEDQSQYEDAKILNNLYYRIFNLAYSNTYIDGISLYTNTGSVFNYIKDEGMEIRYESKVPKWMNDLHSIPKHSFLILPTEKRLLKNGETAGYVSLIRNIYSIPRREKIGSMRIDINVDAFEKLLAFENVNNLEKYLHILIVGENESVIYDQKKEITGEKLIGFDRYQLTINKSKNSEALHNLESNIYGFAHSDYTKWDTVILIDDNFFVYERKKIMLFIGVSGVIVICIIAIISYLLSYNMTKPIMIMMKMMRRVEQGELRQRMPLIGNKEIDLFTRVYNSMLDSINKLITDVYESSIAEKNAKISALQSQINPHFLYNTLNIMKSISRVKGVEEVAEISESLSELFKYNMQNSDKLVTISEEMTHINNYMKIQHHRFGERFILRQEVSSDAKNAFIPKLMIQPLIENAVKHGLANTKTGGLIELIIFRKDNLLIIEVRDNGEGMDKETLKNVRENLVNRKIAQSEESGIALGNIAQRLWLMYGESYSFEIDSKVNEGTSMRIVIPFIYEPY